MKHDIAQPERRVGEARGQICKVRRDYVVLEKYRNPGRLKISHDIVVGNVENLD